MTNDFFRKVDEHDRVTTNKYEKYGFTRNPFPLKPGVNIGSPDNRENGSIYLKELREREQLKFEQLLIKTPENPQAHSISFLMDYATRRGRGIGKTAFLWHQRSRIMNDFGNELSLGNEVLFAIYVLSSPDSKTRKFSQFAKLLIQAAVEQDIIAAAMWRLRAFSGVIPDEVISKVGLDRQETIGNNQWLKEEGIDITWKLDRIIKRQLQSLDINYDLAEALALFGHSKIDFEQHFLSKISDYSWSKQNGAFFFDDLVKVFKAAGFTNGLILVDEVEKLVTPLNTVERRAFTDSLRYYFIDGQCENARYSFYRTLLTIHPYVQELLDPHWKATGLDRFAPLSGDLSNEYTIYFEPLNQESAVPLAIAYLNASRISDEKKGELAPFEKETLEEALVISGRVPGIFLTLLNNTIEKAILFEWGTIKADMVKEIAQARAPKEPGEIDILEPLPKAQIKLKKKD
jgi:hypothetical protein